MIDLINRYARTPTTTGDESLRELGLDDIDLMTIAMDIEDEHGAAISDAEIGGWSHVSCIARTVERVSGARDGGQER